MGVTYAKFRSGRPIQMPYTPGSAVSAGDVIVSGGAAFVAHVDIAANYQGEVACGGGVYQLTADGAITPGQDVFWDATNHIISLTSGGNTPFGKMLAGPDGLVSGAGPATTGDVCYVLHVANGAPSGIATIGASTAAAGSTTTDAGVLPAGTATTYPTTAADDTKGVRVNAADKVTGRRLFIGNGVSNKILKVYPPSGGTINGAAADAAFSSVSGKGVIIECLSSGSNTWLAW
jgi:predicted RecA/RadA family phage recombinase